MLLLLVVALAGSIVIAVLISFCWSMIRDVGDAQEELRQRILQFSQVALSARATEDGETAHAIYQRSQPLRRILHGIAD